MLQYYIWRARYILIAVACLSALAVTVIFGFRILSIVKAEPTETGDTPNPSAMFIVERSYTRESGYSYLYSDGKYLYDNDLQRLPRLSASALDRIEIDIDSKASGVCETYAGSRTINPLSVERAGFQYDIPYNFYGTQQDIAYYIALMLGAGFETESLYETKDSAVLELVMDDETVRIVVGRNRLRIYSKLIGVDEFG